MTTASVSIPVAILGPTGYTGLELIELLSTHPHFTLSYLASARDDHTDITTEFPRLLGRVDPAVAVCKPIDHDAIAASAKLVFLCLPHEAAMVHTPPLIQRGLRVIDLSAAYRIQDTNTYAAAYGHPHTDPANLPAAIYGLTELARDHLPDAQLVANPGCYPTAAALALIPLLRNNLIDPASIIINAASGVSGAGRSPKPNTHFIHANENYMPYALGTHRHQPEINQSLHTWGANNANALFIPHLLPIKRGILETIYAAAPATPSLTQAQLHDALDSAYASEPFVTVRDPSTPPAIADVAHTNNVHVSAHIAHGRVVLVAAIDNLLKGASGQALQNANAMYNFPETLSLAPNPDQHTPITV